MEQEKIGAFISQLRKEKGWTQNQLAEKLGVTDKAVSKWERGKSMPDVSLFLPLCNLLGITLNELLSGEFIPDDKLREKSSEILMEVITNWIGKDNPDSFESTGEADCILNLMHVQKTYDSENSATAVIKDVSFQVPQGCFVGIMGASGSGKSTLLNMIAAIDRPTGGTIEINGQNISGLPEKELAKFRRDHLGVIFQEYNLLETLTLYENIALALTVKDVPKDKIKPVILKLAEKLELSKVLHKYPYEVSGGQRQRCACGRAIAAKPGLILADEPTGALDSHSARQLLDSLTLLQREYRTAILMVTHDAVSASYCDKILFLQDGTIRDILTRGQKTKQSYFTSILDKIACMEEMDYDIC